MANDLKFGTSGLRGLATELDGQPAFAYAAAFARVLLQSGDARPGSEMLIGRDLRASSASIARRCAAAARAAGLVPVDCGEVPTPALAAEAMARGAGAIMVTGSHIPADRNGLKFYRPGGEIDKDDEKAITAAVTLTAPSALATSGDAATDVAALEAYRQRCNSMVPLGALRDMRVGVYQHSSVARDLICDILIELGAEVVRLGRSDVFVPVDTEAVDADDAARATEWTRQHRLDALVSTDGDADRPLIADETGTFLRGDLVGTITADALGADCVVTPVTSNSGIERCGRFQQVLRTRVGSPFVIESMGAATRNGARIVIGFEANGGVLVGSDARLLGCAVRALPTRDALCPTLAVLSTARHRGLAVSALGKEYRFGAAASGRLQDFPAAASAAMIEALHVDGAFRARLVDGLLGSIRTDVTDGIRMIDGDGRVLHYRASGNAPELRCYVEAASAVEAEMLLEAGLGRAAAIVEAGGTA